jgi:predicted alpha/beta-hydrolase family hydrolase
VITTVGTAKFVPFAVIIVAFGALGSSMDSPHLGHLLIALLLTVGLMIRGRFGYEPNRFPFIVTDK